MMNKKWHRAISEALESRRLLSVTFYSYSGELYVDSDGLNDKVSFSKSGSTLNVLDNGVNTPETFSAVKHITVYLGDGTASATLGSSITIPAELSAGTGDQTLVGGGAPTTLYTGDGNDSLVGNAATDYVFYSQTDTLKYTINQSKKANNILDFSDLSSADPVTANLGADLLATYDNVTVHDASNGQYNNFNEIIDGEGDDNLSANNNGNTILAGDGDDYIFGGTGADYITLGGGFDNVACNGGADTVIGGSGHDVIFATNNTTDPLWFPGALTAAAPKVKPPGILVYLGSGISSVVGGFGDDTIIGGAGDCTVHGMGGNDYIVGGQGNSVLFGDSGNDTIYAGTGDNVISGGTGQNVIYGGTTPGTSTFIDESLPDTFIYAGQGMDIPSDSLTQAAIDAAQNNPPTTPNSGTPGTGDLIIGGAANTTIIGGTGSDTLVGGNGPTTLVAGPGNALLIGGNGPTTMQAGTGDDTLAAGNGVDSMTGGSGNVSFLNLNGQPDTITGGTGFSDAEDDPTYQTTYNNIDIYYDPNPEQDDIVRAPAPQAKPAGKIAKPAITPALVSLIPASVVSGVLKVGTSAYTATQNIAISQSGTTITVVQIGLPTLTFSSTAIHLVSVVGGAGDDTINLDSLLVPATANAGNGNNYILGGTGNETLTGGSGNDTIYGSIGNNVISGGAGNNILYGGTGNDVINGGSGSDWINPGGVGVQIYSDDESDTINGGTGTEKVDLSSNGDPMTVRLDKGTITDNATGAVTHIKSVRNIWLGAGNDLVVGSSTAGILITAGSGDDTMFGISASDILYGGAGDDQAFLDGNQGFLDLAGNHGSTPGNIDYYNQGTTAIPPSVDSTDIKAALQHSPP
jgi:Ca2+-binding RTX toxin-like protein